MGFIKAFWLDAHTSFSGLPISFFLDLETLLRPTFLISFFLWNYRCSIFFLYFERTQAHFPRLFVWRETAITWLPISIVSRKIKVTLNKSLFVDLNIIRKVIWERVRLHKIVVFIKTGNSTFLLSNHKFLSNHQLLSNHHRTPYYSFINATQNFS